MCFENREIIKIYIVYCIFLHFVEWKIYSKYSRVENNYHIVTMLSYIPLDIPPHNGAIDILILLYVT